MIKMSFFHKYKKSRNYSNLSKYVNKIAIFIGNYIKNSTMDVIVLIYAEKINISYIY